MDYFEAIQRLYSLGFVHDENTSSTVTYTNGSLRVLVNNTYIEARYGNCTMGGYLKNLVKISKEQDSILFEFDNMLSVDFPLET